MRIGKTLNRLLVNCAYVANQRHLPDVAEVLKQAAVLVGQENLRDVADELDAVCKGFEAKMVAGETVTAEDLPNIPPPAEPDPAETFDPLPDATEEATTPEAETAEDDDFLGNLDDAVDDLNG
jgi:hypothetical protein